MRKIGIHLGVAALCGVLSVVSWSTPARAAGAQPEAQTLNVGGAEGPGGSIKGVAKFDGKQIRPRAIAMSADANCVAAHKDKPAVYERYVWGDNGTLQNVFVFVSKGVDASKTYKPLNAKPELDQMGCMYVPHVMGAIAGQEIVIKNSDNTLHNVHAKPKTNKEFNAPTAAGVQEKISFSKPEEAVPFGCDVHPWMNAFVFVMDNPFFAVTQQDGSYEIKGLPPGEYEVTFWHENDKFTPDHKTATVKVEDGKATELNVTYSPPGKK
jgi:hypothetical protein